MLDVLAEWVDDSLAGGDPPKVVARRAAEAVRAVAEDARQASRGEDDRGGWGPVPEDVTVMLRRRPEGLPTRPAGWRAARYARRLAARIRAWISS